MASLSSSSVAIASHSSSSSSSSSSRPYSRSASFLLPKNTARATHRPPAVSVTAFYTSHRPASPLNSNSAAAATLYDLLELPKTASEAEIKTAYRRLVRQYHPDVAPAEEKEACTKRFLQIHSAYVALSDPEAKRRYDLQLRATIQATPSPRISFSSIGRGSGRGRSWETDQCWC